MILFNSDIRPQFHRYQISELNYDDGCSSLFLAFLAFLASLAVPYKKHEKFDSKLELLGFAKQF